MTRKRKRHGAGSTTNSTQAKKRQKRDDGIGRGLGTQPDDIHHPVLSSYYPRLLSLRAYLLSRLPGSSKIRRRRLAGLGRLKSEGDVAAQSKGVGLSDDEVAEVTRLLDATLVGLTAPSATHIDGRPEEIPTRSQQEETTILSRSGVNGDSFPQSEVVDVAIYHLFHRVHPKTNRPPHLLCHGYHRGPGSRACGLVDSATSTIPGLQAHHPNEHVNRLKGPQWATLLRLLGKEGERVMLGLLVDHAIFIGIETGSGNYYQLSGTPLAELKPLAEVTSQVKPNGGLAGMKLDGSLEKNISKVESDLHTPGSIVIVRNRMLYARAALNAKGQVRFGLRHIHVLNRFPDHSNKVHTVQVLRYIFPRQFGLHNVFTSKVDPRETVQPFKDYTMREDELKHHEKGVGGAGDSDRIGRPLTVKIPKRLRGRAVQLVAQLQQRHRRCAYKALLEHYCPQQGGPVISPAQSGGDPEEVQSRAKSPFLAYATPAASVSAFVRATLDHIIPNGFWGNGKTQMENKQLLMRKVDHFISQRRFESISLHEILQGFKINGMAWLVPPSQRIYQKTSKPESQKRMQLFSEFIYYIFDSLVVPLIRSNFHVTESTAYRNRLFFFRHDVWRSLSEPVLASLRRSMFQDVPLKKVKTILDARALGYSQVRLLPKETGARPIMNLRRRMMTERNGKTMLGRSINSILGPVHEMLKYEKTLQTDRLGGALFSVSDIYPRLKEFKQKLAQENKSSARLYFAKVDVQSCFDTIPQRRVVQLMEKLVSEDTYRIGRHGEIRPPEGIQRENSIQRPQKPRRRFLSKANSAIDFSAFAEKVEGGHAVGKKNAIFVDNVIQRQFKQEDLMDLLEEHVERNLVKIGKKIYRQKAGIPQGSVLSSLLCNFFYGDFEQKRLSFLRTPESLLLRLIDDFLLITLNRHHAEQFLKIMHDGDEEYGISVQPRKSLANFRMHLQRDGDDGVVKVPRMEGNRFPYCGNLIDIRTLEMSKDRTRRDITGELVRYYLSITRK
ncbi:MAG: hypothetical protein M1823_004168 [Watsoniomyces obsoletus]|nr:MAG: hypothetical protein M1823_004168 [Watsoniomyces obsoletus]